MTDQVFVVPPTWPQPPAGWVPPPGWSPDPQWPPAPEGWQFWQPGPDAEKGSLFGGRRRELEAEVEALRIVVAGTREENERLLLQGEALRAEIQRLTLAVEASNAEVRRLLGTDPGAVRAATDRLRWERDAATAQARTARAELSAARAQLMSARDTTVLHDDVFLRTG